MGCAKSRFSWFLGGRIFCDRWRDRPGGLQSGHFTHADAVYVWADLAGCGVGMLADTLGRLYNSTFYALWDTRTPLKFALEE